MNDLKCPTNCREDLINKIETKVPKSIIWKAVLLFFLVWGAVAAFYIPSVAERKASIKTNDLRIQAIRENQAVTTSQLLNIKTTQDLIHKQLTEISLAVSRLERK